MGKLYSGSWKFKAFQFSPNYWENFNMVLKFSITFNLVSKPLNQSIFLKFVIVGDVFYQIGIAGRLARWWHTSSSAYGGWMTANRSPSCLVFFLSPFSLWIAEVKENSQWLRAWGGRPEVGKPQLASILPNVVGIRIIS